jgi:hypothetical protein
MGSALACFFVGRLVGQDQSAQNPMRTKKGARDPIVAKTEVSTWAITDLHIAKF